MIQLKNCRVVVLEESKPGAAKQWRVVKLLPEGAGNLLRVYVSDKRPPKSLPSAGDVIDCVMGFFVGQNQEIVASIDENFQFKKVA